MREQSAGGTVLLWLCCEEGTWLFPLTQREQPRLGAPAGSGYPSALLLLRVRQAGS